MYRMSNELFKYNNDKKHLNIKFFYLIDCENESKIKNVIETKKKSFSSLK